VGALLVAGVAVQRLSKESGRFRLETSKGPVDAGDVLLATNGFSRGLVPWLTRRVIPIGSYLLATAPLDPAVARRLVPRGRVLSDTKELLYYFRLSADNRMIFGGRAAFSPQPLADNLAALRRGMQDVYPELTDTPVEYGWGGTLGFTLDQLPHTGRHDGIAYAVGYGGHGVAYAGWLGDQVGRAMLGRAPWPALSGLPFRAVPFYGGRPWFLPLAGAYYRMRDFIG
jgi:glycine/D-amino acid oxidase-like deaminating enzyme